MATVGAQATTGKRSWWQQQQPKNGSFATEIEIATETTTTTFWQRQQHRHSTEDPNKIMGKEGKATVRLYCLLNQFKKESLGSPGICIVYVKYMYNICLIYV